MSFKPFPGKVEIEPIDKETLILSDDRKYEEMGRVITIAEFLEGYKGVCVPTIGDVIFFLAYGVEETPEFNGQTHYVVPWDERFIIGYIPCEQSTSAQSALEESGSISGGLSAALETVLKSDVTGAKSDDSSMTELPITPTSTPTSETLSNQETSAS